MDSLDDLYIGFHLLKIQKGFLILFNLFKYGWNPSKWGSDYKYVAFREYCLELMETLNWKNNTTFQETITVQQATDFLIFESKDNGKTGAVMLMPSNNSYKEWKPV